MTPPETQITTTTTPPVPARAAVVPAVPAPGRISAAFVELILEDAPSEEFFRRFLLQVLKNSGASGGAVWLAETKTKDEGPTFQLESFSDLSKSGFPFGFDQPSPELLSCLKQVVTIRQKLVVYPARPGEAEKDPANPNTSPYAWFFSSIEFRGGVLGVLALFLDAKWAPQDTSNRITFVDHLGQYVSTHLLLRRKNQAAKTGKVVGKLLEFTAGIVGELRTEELGVFVANEVRDVVGCNRCSVFEFKSGGWVAVSVSGNDEIDHASRLVCAMKEAFSDLAQKGPQFVLNFSEAKPEDPGQAPSVKKLIATSNTRSLMTIVMHDPQGRRAFGLMLESEREGFFAPQAGPRKGLENADPVSLSIWLSEKAGKALVASRSHQSIPFSRVLIWARESRLALRERKGKRLLYFWGGLLAFFVILGLLPWKERAGGECSLLPSKRAVVVAETTGRLTEVTVREGTLVAADQTVAKLDTLSLETNLEIARQERMRLDADVRRFQSAGDMAAYQVAWHQSRKASEQENKLQQDIARAELRSPIAGIVLTKDVDLRRGEVLPIGRELCEVASLQDWNLQVDIDEAEFGIVQNALRAGRPIEVEYILYARSSVKLKAQVQSIDQLSQMAYAKGTQNVFYVTVAGIPLPQELMNDIRPGFSGKARVVVGSRPLFLVMSRKFIHFLRVHWLI
jgi:hypothetical protein